MLALEEMQFELLPSADATSGVGFGIGLDVSVDDAGFDPGSLDWLTQDSDNPTNGVTGFGRDVATGPTWTWSLHVNEDDTASGLAALRVLRAAWRARQIAGTPGAVTAVRYRVGDRVRRVYGRPRNFAAPPDNRLISGLVPITSSFKCADDRVYDDVESMISLGASDTSTVGSFVFPVKFPTSTLSQKVQRQQAVVDGDAPTYPVIRIQGPVTNPIIETDTWTLPLDLSLGPTESVVIDTRPWNLSVRRNDGASMVDALPRRQRFADLVLTPGNHDIEFRASSTSSSTSCAVAWRSAYDSI